MQIPREIVKWGSYFTYGMVFFFDGVERNIHRLGSTFSYHQGRVWDCQSWVFCDFFVTCVTQIPRTQLSQAIPKCAMGLTNLMRQQFYVVHKP